MKTAIGFIFLLIILKDIYVLSESTSHDRLKRSEDKVKSCLDVQLECRRNSSCNAALKLVKKKCTEEVGRCKAAHKDIIKCADNIDILRSTLFPADKPCECQGFAYRKTQKCFEIYNTVHSNPCFDEAVNVRTQSSRQNTVTEPNEFDVGQTTTTGHSNQKPTQIPSVGDRVSTRMSTNKILKGETHEDNQEVSEEDFIEIDELFAEGAFRETPVNESDSNKVDYDLPDNSEKVEAAVVISSTTTSVQELHFASRVELALLHQQGGNRGNLSASEIALIVLGTAFLITIVAGFVIYRKRQHHVTQYSSPKVVKKSSYLVTYKEDETKLTPRISASP